MKYLSLFSGIGGFEVGLGNKHECVGFSEIDKHAIKVYEKHFPNHKNYGNITTIDAATLPDFDLVVGGFPCQPFSYAGKRKGFADTRGTLFFDICRILEAKQPSLLLLENVKGLISHEEGRTFGTIIRTLDELGYDCQWEVLNSKDYGVPQSRKRIFIAGHLRGTPRPQIFPLRETDADATSREIISSPCISVAMRNQNRSKHQHKEGMKYGDVEKKYVLEENKEGISFVVKSVTHEFMLRNGEHLRYLTPVECERLQGFPDGWTEGASDTQRYKMCGNAVTTNVVSAIAKEML